MIMKDTPLTNEEILLCERLRSMKMSGMADAFEEQLLDPNADPAPFWERFSQIVNHEWQMRYDPKSRIICTQNTTPKVRPASPETFGLSA